MEAVIWLEDYLSKWNRILLLISHSQDFLNNVTNDKRIMMQAMDSYIKATVAENKESMRWRQFGMYMTLAANAIPEVLAFAGSFLCGDASLIARKIAEKITEVTYPAQLALSTHQLAIEYDPLYHVIILGLEA